MATCVPLVRSFFSFPGIKHACLSETHFLSRIVPVTRPGGPPATLGGPPTQVPLAAFSLSVRRTEGERKKQKFAAASAGSDGAAAAAATAAAPGPTASHVSLPGIGRACSFCFFLRVPRHLFSTTPTTFNDSSSGPPASAASSAATKGAPHEPEGPPLAAAAPSGGPLSADPSSVTFDLSRIEGTENARDGQLALVFTCCKCSTRSAKKFSKVDKAHQWHKQQQQQHTL